ncbi:hypothetical protein [uncultured Kordia sp.]|uniref:hypothetical protein n=1 Tax=uncultured Kordia sp. TaxID=507699 RepID=UPI002636CE81|nr:hypothetical protein [uncultured Kordia sp.]
MKKTQLILIILLLVTSCNSSKSLKNVFNQTVLNHTGFTPIDPLEYNKWQVFVADTSQTINMRDATNKDRLQFLDNQGFFVSVKDISAGIDANFGSATISSKGSTYQVVLDYAKYRTHSTIVGEARIGIGLRMVANLTTFEAGINLGDLFAIGFAAEGKKLSGTLSVDVIGISSKDATNIIPFSGEINRTTITNTITALATMKSLIHNIDSDDNTRIFPQILSIKPFFTDVFYIRDEMEIEEKRKVLEAFEKERRLISRKLLGHLTRSTGEELDSIYHKSYKF